MTGPETLRTILSERIRREGPITFASYMREALYHPVHGRYSRPLPPMGPEGDYITSPEVDPAFGLLLARMIAEMAGRVAERDGARGAFTIVEAGPGRGLLARDLLQGLAAEHPELAARTRCLLVETSEALRAEQRATLEAAGLLGPVEWVSWEDAIRRGPLAGCLIANEFLDALPVHLVAGSSGRLLEVFVDAGEDGSLREATGEPSTPALRSYFDELGIRLEDGQRAEVNLAALDWIRQAASLIGTGYAVLVDYGHEAADLFSARHFAGTLLGYRRHQLVRDPLDSPGACDLTSHVDFTSVRREAVRSGFEAAPLTSQRKLLVALGLAGLIADLAIRQSEDPVEWARRRFPLHALMSPGGMGDTFKVMVLARGARLGGLRALRDPFRDPPPGAVEGSGASL